MDVHVFHKLLISAIQRGASDIHLQVGYPPLLRINGELLEVKYHPLEPAETAAVVEEILAHTYRKESMESLSELDVSYGLEGQGRFRVNIFRQRGSFGVVLRVIPIVIRNFPSLHLPPVLEQVCNLRRGLVLVVEQINATRRDHIVTIEDPIEFLFRHKMSVISQREVGSDTPSFAKALQAAMRQDPDVIFIGEMRDAEAVEIAIKAAETGHLVLSSMHTTDVVKTIQRLVSFYPPEQEPAIRKRISDCLMAVMAQRLMPAKVKDQLGRIPAVEIMRVTRTIQECIRDASKGEDLYGYVAKGAEMYGMQTFDQHLLQLVKEGLVDIEVAKTASTNPSELERTLMLEG